MFTIVIAHVPFSLISYSFDTAEVMLILILIDVHYSQEAAFCFEKVEMVKITPPQILSELSVKKSLQQIFWFPIGAELPPHLTAIWKILSSKITYGRSSSCVPHSAYAILIFDCFSMNTKLELYCMFLSCDVRVHFRVNPHSIVAWMRTPCSKQVQNLKSKSDCNWTRTLAKWLSVCLRTKWFWVRAPVAVT